MPKIDRFVTLCSGSGTEIFILISSLDKQIQEQGEKQHSWRVANWFVTYVNDMWLQTLTIMLVKIMC